MSYYLMEYPSVPHRPPQFNTSVPHKDYTFSAPEIPQFKTETPQFHTKKPLSSTHPSKLNREVFGVELRDFEC